MGSAGFGSRHLALEPCWRHRLHVSDRRRVDRPGAIPQITLSNTNFADGISIAFLIDAIIALCSAAIALLFLGGTLDCEKLMAAWPHKHRVHA
jgi:hypothetical protein